MAAPDQLRDRSVRAITERVSASRDRGTALGLRAASLAGQVTGPRTGDVEDVPQARLERLFAAQAVAAGFYRARLDRPDGAGAGRWLASQGVPVDGPWAVGYAPDRPAALVNELRRHGFTDVEILASGLASTGRTGQLVDRFRDRVVVGIRDHREPGTPVVGFVGYAPPGAPGDVPPVLHGPATPIYRPAELLFGVAEQPDQRGRQAALAGTALEAIALAAAGTSNGQPRMVVAACGPTLTPGQVATLTAQIDTAAGVTVAVGAGDAGRRAAERAYHLLSPAIQAHPARPGRLWAVGPDPSAEPRPLIEAVVTAHAEWVAAPTAPRPAGPPPPVRSGRCSGISRPRRSPRFRRT